MPESEQQRAEINGSGTVTKPTPSELYQERKGGKFAKNNPGRPPGSKGSRTQRKESMFQLFEFGEKANDRKGKAELKPRIERIKELLADKDPNIRMQAERFVWEADYGKAKQTVDVFHQSQVVEDAREKMREFVESGGLRAVPELE